MLMTDAHRLTDDDLIATIASIAATERLTTASLIVHLAELESRNLHLAQGFKSLFGYCRHVLHCSEHEAYNRMEVVHAARRFPVILPLLADGLLHLTAVRLLAPHLEDEDHLALLGGAIRKSRREIVRLLACWFPSADVPSTVRKLPAPESGAGKDPLDKVGSPTGDPSPEAPGGRAPTLASLPARPAVVAPLSVD